MSWMMAFETKLYDWKTHIWCVSRLQSNINILNSFLQVWDNYDGLFFRVVENTYPKYANDQSSRFLSYIYLSTVTS